MITCEFCDSYGVHEHLCAKIQRLQEQADAKHDLRKALNDADLKILALTDAKAKDHEAVMDLIEVLAPIYLHAKALRDAGKLEDTLRIINKQGVSSLVAGSFVLAIETFEKWGQIMEVTCTEENDHVPNS